MIVCLSQVSICLSFFLSFLHLKCYLVHMYMYLPSFDEDFMKLSKVCDIQILANTHTIGVNVNIRRTITPAKYTADTAYNTTRWINI